MYQPSPADPPTIRVLSLGAGVQSTAVALLAATGQLDRLDAAIFSDTGWEPRSVYAQLDRLEREIFEPAGIPVYRVSNGNIREDALDPEHRFASMPLYVVGPCSRCDGAGTVEELEVDLDADRLTLDPPAWVRRLARWLGLAQPADVLAVGPYSGKCPTCSGSGEERGMARRQCTGEYKLDPIKAKVRELLGAPILDDGRVGRVPGKPGARWAEQWVGISRDEAHRARDSDVLYARNRFPLLELGLTRNDCDRVNRRYGFGETAKSACIGCPFHGNAAWRQLRDSDPEAWADAVEFDAAIRHGHASAAAAGKPLRGQMFLHRSGVPLGEANIDRVTAAEHQAGQGDLLELIADTELEEELAQLENGAELGCSPFACRSDEPDLDVVDLGIPTVRA